MSQTNRLHSTEDLESVSAYIASNKPFQQIPCPYTTRYECKNGCSHPAHTRPATLAQNYSTVSKQEIILTELATRIFNTGVQRKAALDDLLKSFGKKELPLENAVFEQERKKAALESSTDQLTMQKRAKLISSDEYAEKRAVLYVAEERWKARQGRVVYEMGLLKSQTDEGHEGLTNKYRDLLEELERRVEDAKKVSEKAWRNIDEDVRWYREDQASVLKGKCVGAF